MRNNSLLGFATLVALVFVSTFPLEPQAALRTAKYATQANMDYDVVYVRCPRAGRMVDPSTGVLVRDASTGEISTRPVLLSLKDSQGNPIQIALDNWNGANDIWLSAGNNLYQEPGCDLVLHHSADNYRGLPQGHPEREEVLVDCDETDFTKPICTIADPNVSIDGKRIVYTKFMDTRESVLDKGVYGEAGLGASPGHKQLFLEFYPNGDAPGAYPYARPRWQYFTGFKAPALIHTYNLDTGIESRVSPVEKMFSGLAYPNRGEEWSSNVPVMDTGPFFMRDGRIGFTSNRQSGYFLFQLFAMDEDGKNLTLLGHRAMNQQLHPFALKDGRIAYTSFDRMLHKAANNQYSLFTINQDGSDPFILAGKFDATQKTWHYATQLSDGDVVSAIYYNGNNSGLGSLRRFPIDPAGADFEHLGSPAIGEWKGGTSFKPFARVGESVLTIQGDERDHSMPPYADPNDYWIHPSRSASGIKQVIGGQTFFLDKATVEMMGKFTHPAGAPDNDLLVTYTIGGSSNFSGYQKQDMNEIMKVIGKDAGIWLLPLEPNSTRPVDHIADDGLIVVDSPYYHEIMPRAVVPYSRIYGVGRPGLLAGGGETEFVQPTKNTGQQDPRLPAGSPYGLSGASSLYDRETRPANGFPWNAADTGGTMTGRDYTNLSTAGAELAIFDNKEIYGLRVLMPATPAILGYAGGRYWAGKQKHNLRIMGEFPVRKADGSLIDLQGNPDTSFLVRLPADTPFLFQTLDKNGMALDIETTSRTVVRGEQQLCVGCHVHTRDGMDPTQSVAKLNTAAEFGDFTGLSSPLFDGFDASGLPTTRPATAIYTSNDPLTGDTWGDTPLPGVDSRRSFAVDWRNGIADIIQKRCASCHAEGQSAQVLTGLRLDSDDRSYTLLVENKYRREDGTMIDWRYKEGDGLNDVINETPNTDRITRRYGCCTTSRWVSFNSARSSMLVWALYGERLDGRNPQTGLPWGASGEAIPADIPQALRNIPVDSRNLEHAEVWPKVAAHGALPEIQAMPESEKRLIARWIDIGAPKHDVHNDTMRPVLTITPLRESDGSVRQVYVGLWDDSPLDYSRFSVIRDSDGTDITPAISGEPVDDKVLVDLGVTITANNENTVSFTFEIWDRPDRSLLVRLPDVAAANRTRKQLTGAALRQMAGVSSNRAPVASQLVIETEPGLSSACVYPSVDDPDTGDVHIFAIQSQPSNGSVSLVNNCFVYIPAASFKGNDSFSYSATDLGGLSVSGVATVQVKEPGNRAPTATDAQIMVMSGQQSSPLTPAVYDPDAGDTFIFSVASPPSSGVATVVNNQLVYTSNSGYIGGDTFTYRATDSGGLWVEGTANVQVVSPPLSNSAPTATSAHIETTAGTASQRVTPDVTDPDAGDVHTFEIVSQPSNGSASVLNEQLVYTPDAGFVGSDSFTYRATDLGGLSVIGAATVTVSASSVSAGGQGSGGTGDPSANGDNVSQQAYGISAPGGGATTLGGIIGLVFSLMMKWVRRRGLTTVAG